MINKFPTKKINHLIKLFNDSGDHLLPEETRFNELTQYIDENTSLLKVMFSASYKKGDDFNFLMLCIHSENYNKVINYLFENHIHHMDLNQGDGLYMPALFYAILHNDLTSFNLLLSHGANPLAKTNANDNAMFYFRPGKANSSNFKIAAQMLDVLLEKGLDINQCSVSGNNALMENSGKFSHIDTDWLKHLVKKGSSLNIVNNYGYNAFSYAAWKKDIDLVKFYYEKGSNLHQRNHENLGAIELSLDHSYDTECAQYLMSIDELATIENLKKVAQNIKDNMFMDQNIKTLINEKIKALEEKQSLEEMIVQKEVGNKIKL